MLLFFPLFFTFCAVPIGSGGEALVVAARENCVYGAGEFEAVLVRGGGGRGWVQGDDGAVAGADAFAEGGGGLGGGGEGGEEGEEEEGEGWEEGGRRAHRRCYG